MFDTINFYSDDVYHSLSGSDGEFAFLDKLHKGFNVSFIFQEKNYNIIFRFHDV